MNPATPMKPHVDLYRVRSCECAPDGTLRLPRLLDYLQETAADHARELGFDFPVVDEATGARAAWVLAQLRVRLDETPRWRDEVAVDTFPYGVRALAASRDFVIGRAGGGAPYGVATSRWMLIDPAARKAVRVPAYIGALSYDREPVFGPGDPFTRLRWPADAPETPGERYRAADMHIDMNGHVNNVHYAEWMLESVPADFAAAHRLVEMEIVFRSETLRGDFVVSRSIPGPAAADGSPTFLHRVSDPAGRDHVLAQTRWRPR